MYIVLYQNGKLSKRSLRFSCSSKEKLYSDEVNGGSSCKRPSSSAPWCGTIPRGTCTGMPADVAACWVTWLTFKSLVSVVSGRNKSKVVQILCLTSGDLYESTTITYMLVKQKFQQWVSTLNHMVLRVVLITVHHQVRFSWPRLMQQQQQCGREEIHKIA